MNISEIMDCDQIATRLNLLKLDNSKAGIYVERGNQGLDDGTLSWMSSEWSNMPQRNQMEGVLQQEAKSPIRTNFNSTRLSLTPPARIQVCNPPSLHKKYEYECVFCKGNNQPDYVYKNHPIRINEIVVCPSLRTHVCGICGATGDNAHTMKYCPHNVRGFFAAYRQSVGLNGTVKAAPGNTGGGGSQLTSLSSIEDNGNGTAMLLNTGNWQSPFIGAEKKSVVRRLNFDEPQAMSKSTPGFFKNLQQFHSYTPLKAEVGTENQQQY